MKRGILVDNSIFQRLIDNQERDIIIVGTGVLAHDIYNKLLLLRLKVKCFVGMEADHENNIWHFDELFLLEDTERHYFLMCCDIHEGRLEYFTKLTINRLMNRISALHKQMICVSLLTYEDPIMDRLRSLKVITDALNGLCRSYNGRLYDVLGNETNENAFRIHITGACFAHSTFGYFPKSIPEILYDLLTKAGFPCVVYIWGQNNMGAMSHILTQFIRDIRFFKIDLFIAMAGSIDALNPVSVTERNALSTFTNPFSTNSKLVNRIIASYSEAISNGTDNDIELLSLRKQQQRILIALSNLYGFSFWDILLPRTFESDSSHHKLLGLNTKSAKRRSSMREGLIASLDSRYVKDYSKAFPVEEDIFSLYRDEHHFSQQSSELIAKRLADDILNEFAD